MKVIISGLLFGLTIAFSFGPGFWALLQITINKGFKTSLFFLTGFFLSDITFMFIALFSVKTFAEKLVNSTLLSLIASLVMISFGIFSLLKKKNEDITKIKKEIPLHIKNIGVIFSGFVYNTSNPFNLIFWIGVITLSSGTYGLNTLNSYLFIISIFITSFTCDIIKCFFASRLQKIIKEHLLFLINKLVGIVMICCGFFIFWKMCL